MPDLKRYRQKRDPDRTPEPFGVESAPRRGAPGIQVFVVQQHAATRMHWDLRLEIGGVLVSWAVPRGPSLDPAEKRLAVQTEDHPLEYADFEGVIPEGNYGAGAMIVWDRGLFQTVGEDTPAQGLERGKLDLLFDGHKLRGRFALVRTRGDDGKSWLLLCKGDRPEEGEAELVERMPASVLSGLTIAELREGVSRAEAVAAAAREAGAPERELARKQLKPMLATSTERAFSRDGWLFELKYDGVRTLAIRDGDHVELVSRRGRDVTGIYPEITQAVRHLPVDRAVIDLEIVALDARGQASFERLQRRFTQTDPGGVAQVQAEVPVVAYAFDLLGAEGYDLCGLPLTQRKEILARFAPRHGVIRFADHVEGDGQALFDAVSAHDLEGIVAKDGSSTYEPGRRSDRWLKIKVPRTVDLAIVGLARGQGSRAKLGSVALAWRSDDGFTYAGNAGSGLKDDTIDELLARSEDLRVDAPSCANPPEPGSRGRYGRGAPRDITWLRPELVCEVRYTEVTSAGLLRHPVFERLRDDKTVGECDRLPERAEPVDVELPVQAAKPAQELELTRLDKVFWPVEGYTKGDLLAYYEAIWPWLEPYLKDRPVVLTRYPDGIDGKHFYQKNAPDFTPDWARRENIDGTDYFICNDLRTLLYVINSGAIPLHVWHSRLDDLDRPDWLVLDLDPKEAPFTDVVKIARHIHALLDALNSPHFVKTSGQDGLHVLLPLGGALEHREARALGEVLARVVCAELPEIATIARPLAARGDKVYVDFLQNGRGKLIAAPFSVRPRPGAPVSTPLGWRQVTAKLDPARWNIKTTVARMKKSGDPNVGVLGDGVDVEALLGALAERLA